MTKKKQLHLSIPKPCQQDWEKMQTQTGGRFCTNCNKTVVDFSQMSDGELLNYFTLQPAIPCGRFHPFQLNRVIVPEVRKKTFSPFVKKIAAAVATFVSLKVYAANPPLTKPAIQIVQHLDRQIKDSLPVQNISISGTVKGFDNRPIRNAKISSSLAGDFYTDEAGKFLISLKNEKALPQNLIFSFDSLVSVVRSYHPVMGNTAYDVILYKPTEVKACDILMGDPVPLLYRNLIIDFPGIEFKPKKTFLSSDMKSMLSIVASKMKDNPGAFVKIIAYPNKLDPKQKISDQRLISIVNYLVEKLGISRDRLITDKIIDGGNFNTIDFKSE